MARNTKANRNNHQRKGLVDNISFEEFIIIALMLFLHHIKLCFKPTVELLE